GVRRRVRGRTHRRSTTGRGGERAAPTRPSCGAPDPVGTVSAPLARRGTGSGRERGTTWMWFSPDVDRIGDNSAEGWGLCALTVDNRGSGVDGRWGRAAPLPSRVQRFTATPWPGCPAEHCVPRPGCTTRSPHCTSVTWGDADARGVARRGAGSPGGAGRRRAQPPRHARVLRCTCGTTCLSFVHGCGKRCG